MEELKYPDDFDESQCLALEAAFEFVHDVDWAIEKIRKKEYSLLTEVTDEEELGFAYAQSLELPTWAYTYFDFEKFGWDIKAEHSGTMTTLGWFTFR